MKTIKVIGSIAVFLAIVGGASLASSDVTPTATPIPNPCDPVVEHPGPSPHLLSQRERDMEEPIAPKAPEKKDYFTPATGAEHEAGWERIIWNEVPYVLNPVVWAGAQRSYEADVRIHTERHAEWAAIQIQQAALTRHNAAFVRYFNYLLACARR